VALPLAIEEDVSLLEPVAAPGGDPALAVSGLTVTFSKDGQRREVVSGVSYRIESGRTLGIVGESGCGKTMTSLAVMGLTPPGGEVSGSIKLGGSEMIGASERTWEGYRGNRIAMVFQEPMSALNPVMIIGSQIAEVLVRHRQMAWREAQAQAVELLAAVGIPSPTTRALDFPHQLSGGMRQRAMIAIALACRPGVLVADEPTTALDVTIQAQILDLMVELQDQIGMAVQFISHNLAVVSEIAHDIVVMYAGRIVEQASADELFRRPLHPYTQGLIATLPNPDHRVARLSVIPGTVPTLDGSFIGCRFAGRCPHADDHCRAADPQLEWHGSRHAVACFKAGR
jgi:oligopeptide/dipeptide ABC transporter ATP-binding protein